MSWRYIWGIVLLSLILCFVSVGQLHANQTLHPGADVLIVIDNSRSMRWNDTRNLRLSLSEEILVGLQAQSVGLERRLYRYGIVGFTDQPQELIPLQDVIEIGNVNLAEITLNTEVNDSDFYNALEGVLSQYDANHESYSRDQIKLVILITDGELDVVGDEATSASPSNKAYFGVEEHYLREGSLSTVVREFDKQEIQLLVVLTRTEEELANPPQNTTLRFWSQLLAPDHILPPILPEAEDRIFAHMAPDRRTPNLIIPVVTLTTYTPTPINPVPASATTIDTFEITAIYSRTPTDFPTHTPTNTPTTTPTSTATTPTPTPFQCEVPQPTIWCEPIIIVTSLVGIVVGLLALVLFIIRRRIPHSDSNLGDNWKHGEIEKIRTRLAYDLTTLLKESTSIEKLTLLQEANHKQGREDKKWHQESMKDNAKRIWRHALSDGNILQSSQFEGIQEHMISKILEQEFEQEAFLQALVGHFTNIGSNDWSLYLQTLNAMPYGKQIINILADENRSPELKDHIGPEAANRQKLNSLRAHAKMIIASN
jgi:hypothetical protein